jgi:trehalose 6-phosphate phosphatase
MSAETSSVAEDVLEPLADTRHLLVAVDFDGTLSPLQTEPMSARMLPAARRAVERLAALPETTVALVSGRSLVDLRVIAEHGDDSPLWLAGSHGAEFWEPGAGALEPEDTTDDIALRDRLRAEAERLTAGMAGVWIEPKTFGIGVHTRGASETDGAEAHRLVDELVREAAPAWRRRTGHHILEFSFRHEGKDSAVKTLRERTGATAVLFAGDDVTDEDAMQTLGRHDLGVRVGAGETAASVTVDDIPAFADLLDLLARMRGARPE